MTPHVPSDVGGALEVLDQACQRMRLPTVKASEALSRGWRWDAITPRNAPAILNDFHVFRHLFIEAEGLVDRRISRGEERSKLLVIRERLNRGAEDLSQDILLHLSKATRPVEVLRELLTQSSVSLMPTMVSATLGIQEEVVGGDVLRHPARERAGRFGRGGFMYQPSEPSELWPVFELLEIRPDSLFYDLGSGYGHVLFHGAIARPDVRFRGIELMSTRVAACESARVRHGFGNLSFTAGDVTKGGFSDADILFMFNPFPPDTMEAVVELIEGIAQAKPLVAIDFDGLVTQRVSSLVSIMVKDLAPYRVMCSRRFLRESCDLIGRNPPKANLMSAVS